MCKLYKKIKPLPCLSQQFHVLNFSRLYVLGFVNSRKMGNISTISEAFELGSRFSTFCLTTWILFTRNSPYIEITAWKFTERGKAMQVVATVYLFSQILLYFHYHQCQQLTESWNKLLITLKLTLTLIVTFFKKGILKIIVTIK